MTRTVPDGGPPVADRAPVPSVVIAVLTYKRPDDLAALLPLLDAQAADRVRSEPGTDVAVTVVDNDPAGSGRAVCAAAGLARVRHVHEVSPGIAAARTRALAEAADRDVLIFIDDDERPGPGWLAALLGTFAAFPGCAGVVGPVVSSFGAPPDPWIVAGGFFDRRRHPTGTPVPVAATNNLLLDMHAVRAAGLTFDERFGLSGGSDTMFTRRIVAHGGRLVWCDEAVVTDVVPADRATRDWVLRRRFRIGNSLSRTELALAGSGPAALRVRSTLLARGLVRVLGGASRMGLGLATRRLPQRAGGARTVARGLGIALGALGWTYAEYGREPRREALGALVRLLRR